MKTSKKKPERSGGAEDEVHLSDRLGRMISGLCGPIGLQIFCLGRFGFSGGYSLKGAGTWGTRELAEICLVRVIPLWLCYLGFDAIRGACLRGSGGLISSSCYRGSIVKDLSLRGCAKDSVRGQGGGLWRFAMVCQDFGLVPRLLFGFVLE